MQNKIRVLFVISQLGAGGSERIVLDLAKKLNNDKFDIYLLAFSGGILQPYFKKNCKKIIIYKKKFGFDILLILKIFLILLKFQINIINAHHYMPLFYSAMSKLFLFNIKLVYTEHSAQEVDNIFNSIHRYIFRILFVFIYKVVGVSEEVSRAFVKNYPESIKKITTILNGVDIKKFSGFDDRIRLREQLNLLPEHFVIGTVANFRKVKNHACIVRAASRLKFVCPLVRFLFVGTGFPGDSDNSEDLIRNMIEEFNLEDHVFLTGYHADISMVLPSMDVFCLSSFSEGLPVSILEAMAARVLVVGSNVPGIREVVDNNRTGLLFRCDNDAELSSIICELYNGTLFARNLVGEAFRYVEENHSYQKFCSEYASLFVS